MSFAMSETVKWTEEIRCGISDLIDRNFVINESRGHCGLKVSVNFRRTLKNNPEMKMKIIEGAETLNDPVSILLEFKSEDGEGSYRFHSNVGLNVESFKSGYSCPRFSSSLNNFRRTHASESVTYTMTFDLKLKNLVASCEPKKMHEKLYLDQETSDVKIDCKGKIFPCHRIVLR